MSGSAPYPTLQITPTAPTGRRPERAPDSGASSPRPLRRRTRFALAALVLGGTLGCRSRADFVEEADRQVYEILAERRAEFAEGEPLVLRGEGPSLREEILAGEASLGPMSLVECLEIAAENSRDFQTRREALYLAALDLTLEEWQFSVQQNGSFGAFLQGRGRTERAGLLSNFGLTKLFESGLQVAGNIGVDLVRNISTGDGWDAVSNLSLNITQPLLRGFGTKIVREPLTQAERTVLYEARVYERFRRTFAFDVASNFFRILQQENVLQNERQNEANLGTLRERNEAFAEAGLLNDIQVDQARQNELAARNRVIDAERQLQAQLDDFKLFLGLPIEMDLVLDEGENLDLEAWDVLGIELSQELAIEVALERRLDYLTLLDRVVDAERRSGVIADSLRAGLDINANVNGTSAEGRPLEVREPGIDFDVSIAFDAPLNRVAERNAYRESLIVLERARRAAIQGADQIRADVRDGLRRLVAARQSYEIQTNAVVLADRRVESAQLNLEAGRASTRDVLEATEDLVQARNAATGSLTQYILSGLGLYRDMELVRVGGGSIEIETELLAAETGATP